MVKKDYIKLADTIKMNTIGEDKILVDKAGLLFELCQILKDDNPRFDRERFLTACK